MNALGLGLVAAMAWGFHDICVRFLSQKTPISSCMFVVLLVGLVFHVGLMSVTDGISPLPMRAVGLSVAAGVCFVIATYGLYLAFQRGPVRLVSPLIASYPILSVGWAASQGVVITLWQWGAIMAILIGVAAVAALSDVNTDDSPPKGPTIGFAIFSACGFAGTFAFGQEAAAISNEMSTTLVTRIVAVAAMSGIILIRGLPFLPGRAAMPWLIAMGVADGVALLCVLSAGNLPNSQYAAVSSSMFGLLTILLAWVLLKERMSLTQWSGCALAFAGVGYLAL